MTGLGSATEAYQAQLEHHRAAVEANSIFECDDSVVEQLAEDLARAEVDLAVAFARHELDSWIAEQPS